MSQIITAISYEKDDYGKDVVFDQITGKGFSMACKLMRTVKDLFFLSDRSEESALIACEAVDLIKRHWDDLGALEGDSFTIGGIRLEISAIQE